MVQYWICISNYPNAKVTVKENIWGVSDRYENAINKVKIGDILLIYARSTIVNYKGLPSAVIGAFEVISNVYKDNKKIFDTPEWMANTPFPFRVKLKSLQVFKKPVLFKPLVPKLSFIKNKKMWSGSIRTAMRLIPEEDYRLILKEAKKG